MAWLLGLLAVFTLSVVRASLWVWTVVVAVGLLWLTRFGDCTLFSLAFVWGIFFLATVLLNVKAIRRKLFTRHIIKIAKKNKT